MSKWIGVGLISLLLLSCRNTGNEPIKPSPTGAPGDLLLVISDKYWQSASGDTLRSMLAGPVEALPQDEPQFRVTYVNHSVFDKQLKTQRNIVIVKVGSDQLEPGVRIRHGMWAKGQILIAISARSEVELLQILNAHRVELMNELLNAERLRLIEAYESAADPKLVQKLKEKGLELSLPKGFKLDVEKDDFMWFSQEYRDVVQGILIYYYDYTDSATFTPEYLLARRNEILQKNVPGETAGSYMTTEALFQPLFREYAIRNQKYTAELRGLWKMQNGMAMGGPFINITQLDEARNRVVSLDAFVFAPGHDKRDLLRQLEAILLTINFTPTDSTQIPSK